MELFVAPPRPAQEPEGASDPGAATGNALLQRLTLQDFSMLRPHLRRVTAKVDDVLASARTEMEHVYFPECGIVGLLDVLDDKRCVTMGLVGREGCLGWPLLHGDGIAPYSLAVTGADGTFLAVQRAQLPSLIEQLPALRDLMLQFASTFTLQMGRTIVSNLIHTVEGRAARWLLLYHDRLVADVITIKHRELGFMLGVRRASITDALHALEGEGAIRGERGRIIIRDRGKLEQIAGQPYGFAESEYRRLIGTA